MLPRTVQQVKRWLKIVAGFALLVAGVIMLVTPGPGWVTMAMGLALLATEYGWAQRLLQRIKAKGKQLREVLRPSSASSAEDSVPQPHTAASPTGDEAAILAVPAKDA